jgi:hypothetical protein
LRGAASKQEREKKKKNLKAIRSKNTKQRAQSVCGERKITESNGNRDKSEDVIIAHLPLKITVMYFFDNFSCVTLGATYQK